MEGVEPEQAPHSRDLLSKLDEAIRCVVQGRARQVDFEETYRCVYDLVLQHGRGKEIYDLCVDTFTRMAVFMGRKRYDLGARLISDLCVYMERVWARLHNHGPLLGVANEIYECPRLVARRRWRKAIRRQVRKQRILDWLVVFNQHAFRPKGHSAARVAQHYAAFVAEHEA